MKKTNFEKSNKGIEMAFELRTRWYRVAVAGDSVDGREITDAEINELVETYSTDYYTANIYNEHIRAWGCYGQVVALKAEVINKPDVPELDGKLALFAVLSPNQFLIELNKQNQKIFTSIEIWPDFQKTGKVYLAGFAITDEPGSVGTEALKFNAKSNAKFTDAVDNDFAAYLKESEPAPINFHAQIPVKQPQEEPDMTPEQFQQMMDQQKAQGEAQLAAIKEFSAKPAPANPEGDDGGDDETAPMTAKQFKALTDQLDAQSKTIETLSNTVTEQAETFSKMKASPFDVTDPDSQGEEGFTAC